MASNDNAGSSKTLKVAVITPEGAAFQGEAKSVTVPAFDGLWAFFPDHAPFVGALGVGELCVHSTNDEKQYFYLQGGVVRVANNDVSILAEAVTPLDALDVEEEDRRLAEILGTKAMGSLEALDARQLAADASRARKRLAARAK